MSPSSHRPALVAIAAALVLAATLADAPSVAAHPRADHHAPRSSPDAAYAAERVRIRIRLDSVLGELRLADVARLSTGQRAVRADRIAALVRYRDRGEFPHNHDFHDAPTPYFVDHRGVICAVGWLLQQSGRQDIVDRVRMADNNVRVPELAGDAEFRAWLDASGLTLAEAARIQMPYDATPSDDVSPSRTANRVNTAAALLSSGLGVASIAWNAMEKDGDHRRLRAALGFTAGAAGLAVAATRMPDARGTPLAVGISSGAIGVASAVMATRALLGTRGTAHLAAPAPSSSAEPVAVSVAPTVVSNGERMTPGFALNVRF